MKFQAKFYLRYATIERLFNNYKDMIEYRNQLITDHGTGIRYEYTSI